MLFPRSLVAMGDATSIKALAAQDEIIALARKHGVTYKPMPLDKFGEAMSRLAGDDVELDDTELLLLALERAGHLLANDANRLHVAYMNDIER
jgi:hypothetical protein